MSYKWPWKIWIDRNGLHKFMLQRFIDHIAQGTLFSLKDKIVIAVSGGLDSVVLCQLCRQAGYQFSIAHCNFNLRETESTRDENFVRNLAEKFRAEIFVENFDTDAYAAINKLSIQLAARNLRYTWFAQLKKEQNFYGVLLAHHANDNIETVMMNFFRGTGLEGLTGMLPVRDGIFIRPLLPFYRKELEEFAAENNLEWVEDSSNASSKYTRNFFRNELLPQIKKIFPQVEENIVGNIKRFTSIERMYEMAYADLKKKICVYTGLEMRMPIKKLQQQAGSSFLFEIISEYGFGEKQLPDVQHLFDALNGKFIANEKFQIIKHGLWLIVAPRQTDATIHLVEEGEELVKFHGKQLAIKKLPKKHWHLNPSPDTAQLNAKHITFPLVLRRWKTGDYFYPLGMTKKKKLARFFIDLKLPKNKKEEVWVVESDKKIIWVVGLRIDNRFRVTDSTKDVLQLTIS